MVERFIGVFEFHGCSQNKIHIKAGKKSHRSQRENFTHINNKTWVGEIEKLPSARLTLHLKLCPNLKNARKNIFWY
jgi:hypothetical protein